jgi:hypothetical protein
MAIKEYASLMLKMMIGSHGQSISLLSCVVFIVNGFSDIHREQSVKSRPAAQHLSTFHLSPVDHIFSE